MKIYFAMIEKPSEMKEKADAMLNLLSIGDMEGIDKLTNDLVSFSDQSTGIYLSDEDWNSALQAIRSVYPDFLADIVLEFDSVNKLNQITNDLPSAIRDTVRLAFERKCGILELPLEDEKDE